MDFVKEWTICVCVTLVISVIFSILTPSGRLSSFYKIIISVFVFLSFLYPFTVSNVSFNKNAFDDFVVEDKTDEISENIVNTKINDLLISNDIVGANVSSSVTCDDEEITINDIQVAIPDEYSIDEVKNMIYDNLSINARVIHIGE